MWGREVCLVEKRSLKNVVLTRKYHWLYLGKVTAVSVGLVPIIYGYMLGHLFTIHDVDPTFPLQLSATILTLGALLTIAMIIYLGVVTAHRVAGPHIQLQQIFEQIKAGDLNARLHFRGGDRLEDVEDSFNSMMDALQSRIDDNETDR